MSFIFISIVGWIVLLFSTVLALVYRKPEYKKSQLIMRGSKLMYRELERYVQQDHVQKVKILTHVGVALFLAGILGELFL